MAKSDITGDELLEFLNKTNVSQTKLESLRDLKDWILEQELDADVLMINYLISIDRKLDCLPELVEQQIKTNRYLGEILS